MCAHECDRRGDLRGDFRRTLPCSVEWWLKGMPTRPRAAPGGGQRASDDRWRPRHVDTMFGQVRPFRIVAHRGATGAAPENTLDAFRRAAALRADAVELDVRLTRDRRPVVYHYFYLEAATTGVGPIFERTVDEVADLRIVGTPGQSGNDHRIPGLQDVLAELGGQIGFEIELKGPEPEAAPIVGEVLSGFRQWWDTIEVTSFEPALLLSIRRMCPGISTALLFPRSEGWMRSDVVAYAAAQRARLAHAGAVHLHPTQLTPDVVSNIRAAELDVHAYEVNDGPALALAADLRLPWICTDELEQALAFRPVAG